jgi:hypothetical protein
MVDVAFPHPAETHCEEWEEVLLKMKKNTPWQIQVLSNNMFYRSIGNGNAFSSYSSVLILLQKC